MKALVVACVLCLCGCGRTWNVRNVPTTAEERAAVAEHAREVLSAIPKTLSGDDQDWDDSIREAHEQAREILCEPTLWEWDRGECRYTGNWKKLNTDNKQK